MITRDNIGEVLKGLNPKIIEGTLLKPNDYITLEVHIFNAGYSTWLRSVDYDEELEQEMADNGQLFCDKDDFRRLLDEQGIEYDY